MATNYSQDKDFRNQVISESLLEDAVDWIASNLPPEYVFSESQLEQWAANQGFIKPDKD